MTKQKAHALVVLHGGPHDGRTLTIGSHDELDLVEDGCRYERQDAQEGDYRVYRFVTADGEALPTATLIAPELENRLHADLAALAAEEKANPGSKKRPAG